MTDAMETVKISKESYAWQQLEANPIGTAAELSELKAALAQSRAENAAAYDRAADYLYNGGNKFCVQSVIDAIRALATQDQSAALDAVRAEALAQGMREAAIIAHDKSYMDAHDSIILAAIKGAKA